MAGPRRAGHVARWWTERSYGFITPDDGGPDVFVHRGDLSDVQHALVMQTDTRVTFLTEPSDRGPKATQVEVIPVPQREALDCGEPEVVVPGDFRAELRQLVAQHTDGLVNDMVRMAERHGWVK